MLLDFDPRVTAIAAQPFWLRWRDDAGRSRRHAPDLFARLADGSGVVIDVRPDDRIKQKDAEAFDATRKACGLAGWGFRRVGVPDPVLVANVAWLARYRHPRCGSPDLAGLLLEGFAEPAPLMAGAAAVGDPIAVLPALFHLMWRHALVADLAVRLTADALVVAGAAWACPVTGPAGRAASAFGDRFRLGQGSGGNRGVGRLSGSLTPGARLSPSACPACWRTRTSPCWMPGRGRASQAVSVLDGLPAEAVQEARWWRRHTQGAGRDPGGRGRGGGPAAGVRPAVVTLTRREQAEAAELTAAGHPVSASAIAKRRRRYQEQGLIGMIDHRAGKRMPPHGRAHAAVVAAMRQAISEAAGRLDERTAVFVLRRTRQILAESGGEPDGGMPSRSDSLPPAQPASTTASRHRTGSASTRRSLAGRPEGPFGQAPAAAPGDLMQIDSTPLDVLVRLDGGVTGRVDLTGIIDVATRTVTAAVLRPTTKWVDASVLLARTVTPEPMRPGWPRAMRMSESAPAVPAAAQHR